jgi:molybdenum cofactor cytidylyltransferase
VKSIALLLAAGASERMGRSKPLLPWGEKPLVAHQLAEIQRSRLTECVVVLGREAQAIEPWVRPGILPGWKAHAIVNPRPEEGRSSSIRIGLKALGAPPDAILVASVDQPLRTDLIDALLARAESEWSRTDAGRRTVVLPTFQGRRGHPPLFHGALHGELLGVSETGEGLRQVVRRIPERVLEMPWHRDDILLNLNSPLDLPPTEVGPELQQR